MSFKKMYAGRMIQHARLVALLLAVGVTMGQKQDQAAGKPGSEDDGVGLRDGAVATAATLPQPPQSVTCPTRNKCTRRDEVQLPYHDRNCFCDDLCDVFGDCCKDHPRAGPSPRRLQKGMISCRRVLEINPQVEIYMVDSCPRDYHGDSEIQAQCEMDTTMSWDNGEAFFRLPVTGNTSKITYKNYYCALCSGDMDVKFWHIRLDCGEIPQANRSANPQDLVNDVMMYIRQNKYFCGLEFSDPGIPARLCKSHIARCDKSWKDQKVKKKCKSHTAYVYVGKEVFKNKYCAVCNYVNDSYLSCEDTRTPQGPGDDFIDIGDIMAPFSVLLDINTGKGLITERGIEGDSSTTHTDVRLTRCQPGHVYDPFAKICRQLRCENDYTLVGEKCLPKVNANPDMKPSITAATTPGLVTEQAGPVMGEDVWTTSPHHPDEYPDILDGLYPVDGDIRDHNDYNDAYTANEGSDEDQNTCNRIAFVKDDYMMFDNLSLVIFSSGQMYSPMEYDQFGGIVYVCAPYENSTSGEKENISQAVIMFRFDRLQGLVSFVGVLVSAVALLIMLVVYMMLPSLRNISGMCIMSVALALFFAQMLFLVGLQRTEMYYVCLTLGAAMHYTFLVAFFWVNVMAYDIWRSFSARTIKQSDNTCRFVCYSLYAWLVPAVIVGGSVGMDFLDSFIGDMYRPHYGEGICWLVRLYALILLFALPMAIILIINIIFYIASIRCIYIISKTAKSHHHQQQKIKDRGKLVLYIKLSFIMGLTWIFAFIAVLTHMPVMWYVFISFNTLQGIFICCAFVCNRKVFRLLQDKGRVHRMHQYNDGYNIYGNSQSRTYMTRHTYLTDGEARIISQETSI